MVSSTDVLRGRRFGNVVLAATAGSLDIDELRRQVARQPFPAGVRSGKQLAARFVGAHPWTDADAAESPEPVRGWRIR